MNGLRGIIDEPDRVEDYEKFFFIFLIRRHRGVSDLCLF